MLLRVNLELMQYWLFQLLLVKLGLLKRRHVILVSDQMLSNSFYFFPHPDDANLQVPLYKHIADLAGGTNLTLPVPAFSVISGGKHAGNNLAIQVFSLKLMLVLNRTNHR